MARHGWFGASLLVVAGWGGFAGYKIAERKLEQRFAELAEQEINDARDYFARHYKVEDYATPEAAARAILGDEEVELINKGIAALGQYAGVAEHQVPKIEEDPVVLIGEHGVKYAPNVDRNAFVDDAVENFPHEGWDWDAELAARTPDQPYIITREEFVNNESEYEQSELDFYAGDHTLCDDKEQVVYDIKRTVGKETLERFGHGSGDSHVVYVRNDKRSIEFEITKNEGKYSQIVMQIDELEHSDYTRRTKRSQRGDDG